MGIPSPAIGFNQYVNYGPPLYAYSPPIQKFTDTLPGLGKANTSTTPSNPAIATGAYIPVAIPDKTVYKTAFNSSADDYYDLTENEYTQVLHSGMPPTLLRGYAQSLGTAPRPDKGRHRRRRQPVSRAGHHSPFLQPGPGVGRGIAGR